MSEDTISRKKILIVDDEEANLDIIAEYLDGEEYEVMTARDGLQAMDILHMNKDIKVVLLDRMMPNMDGIEVVTNMKKDDDLKNIDVIMQTAATSIKQMEEGYRAGVKFYLPKPFTQKLLLAMLKKVV